jgi:hypothetical protein
MKLTRLHYTIAFVLGFLLVTAGALFAQASTTAPTDKLGLFGPVLDHLWPVITTFLTSATVWIVAKANDGFARTPEPVKWIALYAFALAYNKGAMWLGLVQVDPLAPVLALSAVQTGAAALVFKFGQHKVPYVPAARPI